MYEQVHDKQQTAQMAELIAHKERKRWEREGGPPPLHSHYGQVCCPPPPRLPPPSFVSVASFPLGAYQMCCCPASSYDWCCRLLKL